MQDFIKVVLDLTELKLVFNRLDNRISAKPFLSEKEYGELLDLLMPERE
jgi:hypothetical protein